MDIADYIKELDEIVKIAEERSEFFRGLDQRGKVQYALGVLAQLRSDFRQDRIEARRR